MWLRVTTLDLPRMPPIASAIVDPAGTDVMARWIDSLSECPAP